ncbi:MAG: hypothetical protein MUE85_08550 [Microscillaceae bacterium]|jgi:hypothetical protein|nr:hypothetical protein [Microscillaceae bacterium]
MELKIKITKKGAQLEQSKQKPLDWGLKSEVLNITFINIDCWAKVQK